MKVRFLTLAEREVDAAVLWYEQQTDGLSRDFLDELDRVVRLVKTYPTWRFRLNLISAGFYSRDFLIH